MSSQRAAAAAIAWLVSGSASPTFSIVSSENTTPKPNVSSTRFRSYTVTRWLGSCRLSRMAR